MTDDKNRDDEDRDLWDQNDLWDEEDVEEFVEEYESGFSGFNTPIEFDTNTSLSMSEEDELAIKLYKAGSAMRDFIEYIETHDDFDPDDDRLRRGMDHLSGDQRALMHAFASFGQDLEAFADHFEDDDDENPFKVN